MARGWRAELKRYAAPVAFLALVTIAVLLVRQGLQTSSSSATTSGVTTTAGAHPTSAARRANPRYYRLRAGETISDVAIRFNTTVEQLLALNPGIDPNALDVGQRVRIR